MERKRFTFFVLVVSLFFINFSVHAQNEIPKYGNDSVSCVRSLSLYSEFYKQKNLVDATGPWLEALNNCPRASKNLYIHGDKIMKYRIKKEKDKVKREAIVDSLLWLYDMRIKYFGQEGFVTGRKGNAIMSYVPQRFEEAYGYFERSFELEGKNCEAQVLVLYMQCTNLLYNSGKIEKEKVIENYSKITDVIDQKIKLKNSESNQKAKNNIDVLFDKSGTASCESLIGIYTDKFNKTSDNVELLKKITYMLDKYDCTESELFIQSSEKLYELEPSAESAYMLAKMFLKKREYDKSTRYYKEAIEAQNDSLSKSRYYYELALLTHSQQSNPELARSYCYQSLKYNPNNGQPYILIGDIYAASVKTCGENEFEQAAVYWVAVDKFITAKRKDTASIEIANERITTFSKYFPDKENSFFYGHHEGQEYTVGCWINEKTIVRFE